MTEYGESILNAEWLQETVTEFKNVLEWGSERTMSVYIGFKGVHDCGYIEANDVEFALSTVPPLEEDGEHGSRFTFKDEPEMARFLEWLQDAEYWQLVRYEVK